MLTRRDLLCSASAALSVLAFHRCAARVEVAPGKVSERPHRFRHLRLRTSRLEPMRRFYAETLELPVVPAVGGAAFTVTVGESTLEFVRDETEPAFYHFAINVPENLFEPAKRWLARRTTLLRDSETGEDQLFFSGWNAHAVYFADPAGNIGELIARHTLPIRREGEFGPAQMLHVSEIGLVSPTPDELAGRLMAQFGLSKYGGSSFFVGDEYGLFVLPPVGRPWIPERRQAAKPFPAEVSIRDAGGRLELAGLPFVVATEPPPTPPTSVRRQGADSVSGGAGSRAPCQTATTQTTPPEIL